MSPAAIERKLSAFDAYEIWADSYDTDPNPLLALQQRCFPLTTDEFRDRDVLELGCGTGRSLKHLEPVGPRSLTGIDASPSMLAVARSKCAATTHLVEGDCLASNLPSGSADCVISSFVLAHISSILHFAREAGRLVRSGGVILIADLHPRTASYGWRQTFRSGIERIEVETFPYTLNQLVDEMRSTGCTLDRLDEACFGEPEAEIFARAGKMQQYDTVLNRPVIYQARFTMDRH